MLLAIGTVAWTIAIIVLVLIVRWSGQREANDRWS
jgi:hypothetical protein